MRSRKRRGGSEGAPPIRGPARLSRSTSTFSTRTATARSPSDRHVKKSKADAEPKEEGRKRGSAPNSGSRTTLQKHVDFFDSDRDGKITFRSAREEVEGRCGAERGGAEARERPQFGVPHDSPEARRLFRLGPRRQDHLPIGT